MAAAAQANLPWPISFMSVGNLVPMPNAQHRSRLLRFLQDMRNFHIPNHTDLCEALNWYNCKDAARTITGVYSYIHRKVLDIPKSNQPLPRSMNVLLPTIVAKDISLPWIPMSNPGMNVRNGANGAPKYRFVFFIYRHRPTMDYNPLLVGNIYTPEVVYTMSYWDRENPANMTWVDFKDEPRVDRDNRFADVHRFWINASVKPDTGFRAWFVDPQWYLAVVRHASTRPATTNTAWAALEHIQCPAVQPYTLFSVMAAIIYMTNDIYAVPGTPAGQPTPTPGIPDDYLQITGMHTTLLPELYCVILHCLRSNHNGVLVQALVRDSAHLPVLGIAGVGFGLLSQSWVQEHLSISPDPKFRYYRQGIKLALTTVPGRLAAPGVFPNLNQFPAWYENLLT